MLSKQDYCPHYLLSSPSTQPQASHKCLHPPASYGPLGCFPNSASRTLFVLFPLYCWFSALLPIISLGLLGSLNISIALFFWSTFCLWKQAYALLELDIESLLSILKPRLDSFSCQLTFRNHSQDQSIWPSLSRESQEINSIKLKFLLEFLLVMTTYKPRKQSGLNSNYTTWQGTKAESYAWADGPFVDQLLWPLQALAGYHLPSGQEHWWLHFQSGFWLWEEL